MKLNGLIVIVSFLVLIVSFLQRNVLPQNLSIVPQVRDEPRQESTRKSRFDSFFNGVSYTIYPEYAYELHGVVVSYRHHEGNSRMHKRAKDHLNMLDVCVVWGNNAGHPALQKFDFWNGIFTCVFKTDDSRAWEAFRQHELSNNHLISDDSRIRERVRRINVGDQIRVRGYLASYSSDAGGKRGTSTSRFDTGDGACETIYVEDFEIVAAAAHPWRISMYASLGILMLALVAHFRRPYRPYPEDD